MVTLLCLDTPSLMQREVLLSMVTLLYLDTPSLMQREVLPSMVTLLYLDTPSLISMTGSSINGNFAMFRHT